LTTGIYSDKKNRGEKSFPGNMLGLGRHVVRMRQESETRSCREKRLCGLTGR
jgi:hypothetical protein